MTSMQSQTDTTVYDQALEWLVVFWSGEVTAGQRADWQNWLATSAAHECAWQEVKALEQRLQNIPAGLAANTLRQAPKSPGRRKLLQLMAVVLATGTAAQMTRETVLWRSHMADYRTRTGEQQNIALADGTQVSLNTASAMDVRFNAHERRLILREGEVFIVTAPDNAASHRPFIVETRQGTARALGTRFNVRQFEGYSRVAVFEGAVEITPEHQSPRILQAGEQTLFSANHVGATSRANAMDHAWMDGRLVAERMRLKDFLAELSRYRPGIIRCDESVSDQIVSGVYPLNDTDRILQSLNQALPIRLTYATRYWVSVQAALRQD